MENSIIVLFEKAFWKISWNDFFFFPIKMRSCTFYVFPYQSFGADQKYWMLCCFIHLRYSNQQMASRTVIGSHLNSE